MAIDRDATLRKAEKFLRQGRLDQAIAEYLQVVREQPRDWSTINTVGDLLVRAGQIESAVEHYTRIADHFFDEGFLPRAAAVYKKILKLKPDEDHALLRGADICEQQGLVAGAKAALVNAAERRLRRGDHRGAAEIQIRLAGLDPADVSAGIAAARAEVEIGDAGAAVQRLVQLAKELQDKGRQAESLQALDEAAQIDPRNNEVREALVIRYMETGELERALTHATLPGEFKAIAAELFARGKAGDALVALERALDGDPEDIDTRRQLARSYLAQGDLERTRACLSGEVSDPDLLLVLAEVELRSGRLDAGRDLAAKILLRDPTRREELVLLGCRLCEHDAEAAFQCVDVATDAAVADSDWPAAASALHEYVTRVADHIPALMKLVEVCVDGGLEATMYSAQAQLADAYLKAGRGNEARVISEDLVAREPWDTTNIDRFRRALVMLGESDPDAVIADRLSGDSPFTSTDFMADFDDIAEAAGGEPGEQEQPRTAPAERVEGVCQLGPAAIDVSGIVGGGQPVRGEGNAEAIEIDLSEVIDELSVTSEGDGAGEAGTAVAPEAAELERVFEGLREQASRQAADSAAQQLEQALEARDAGDTDTAIRMLEQVVRLPRCRFEAAAALGRICRDTHRAQDAIDWFERAAESAPASSDATRELLYDLGTLLADAGETERALAVFLELEADAPGYRDVAAVVQRLSHDA